MFSIHIEYNELLADGTALTSKFFTTTGLNKPIMKTDFKHHPDLNTFVFIQLNTIFK